MNNMKTELEEKLRVYYRDQKFYNGLLHETCDGRWDCWSTFNYDLKASTGALWNSFSEPYIGEKYSGRLVCVGLNINKGGGRFVQKAMIEGRDKLAENEKDQFSNLYFPGVRDTLRQVKKREKGIEVGFKIGMKEYNRNYSGTKHWYKIAVYASILLNNWRDDLMDDGPALADIFEHIIYMDVVKCSPNIDESRPSPKMAETCIKKIFFEEIEIIQPETILVVNHLAAELMRRKYAPAADFPGTSSECAYCKMTINNKPVNVFYVMAPTFIYAKNINDLPRRFAEFVQKCREVKL
jgi:hypothetical protein